MKQERLPYKLTKDQEALALEFMQKNATEKVIINDLQRHLNAHQEICKISRASAYTLLKKVLKYTYKKSHIIPRKMRSKEKFRELCEALYIQYFLTVNDYSLIFVDEFHISFK